MPTISRLGLAVHWEIPAQGRNDGVKLRGMTPCGFYFASCIQVAASLA